MPLRSTPTDLPGWAGQPRGLSTLFFTEMWERFSYYGMRALLVLFMVAPVTEGGMGFAPGRAGLIYGTYTMSVFLLAVPGGFLGDNFLGARRAVLVAGLIIACGHFTLAFHSEPAFFAGLALVALGSGLLKANMSAMVGSLYQTGDARRDAGFSIFYMGVNLGAFLAPLVTGYLAQSAHWKSCLVRWGFDPAHSWHWGFAAAGLGMTIGLAYYLATAGRIAHIGQPPPPGTARPWRKLALVLGGAAAFFCYVVKSDEPDFQGMRWLYLAGPVAAIGWFGFQRGLEARRLAAVFIFFVAAMVFWAIFEQGGSTFALFGDRLTRAEAFGRPFPSAWFQSLGSIFVVLLAPAFAWLWLRLGRRQPSSPAKFALGLGLLGLSFVLMIPAARLAVAGRVSPLWLVGLFGLQSLGELCLSPVGLSTMTKLAPARLGGLVMGIWFLADSLGNKLAGVLAGAFTAENPAELATVFGRQALVVAAATLALVALVPWTRKLMGNVE